jgi:sporulation protein YlmC with PRC-barrel domain
MLKLFSALLVGLTMVALPAHAQDTQRSNTRAQTEQNASDAGMWQASKLIGVNVYNGQNEKIGDIKELMVDKDGKLADVVIGVGGFLGMGERDVAVKFSELKWSDEPALKNGATWAMSFAIHSITFLMKPRERPERGTYARVRGPGTCDAIFR